LTTGWQGLDPWTQTWPTAALPPATPFTFHSTLPLVVPVEPFTCAVSVTRWLAASVAVLGVTLTPTPGAMASVACASFEGSASGVTAMVTVLGVGALLGAVYVAEFDNLLAPADSVVIVVSVPHPAPLQPVPVSDHASTWLGFDPGTAVSVATIAAVALAGTLLGAEMISEKWLVMVTAAEACFDGSATLCAVSVTTAGDGKICGAVKFPWASTAPHALGQPAPETLQRNVLSGCPELATIALNACNAPSSTPVMLGVICTTMSLVIAALALSDLVGSAALVAVTRTLPGDGKSAGAVYTPADVMVPAVVLPPVPRSRSRSLPCSSCPSR
jgi:hypothetical protein